MILNLSWDNRNRNIKNHMLKSICICPDIIVKDFVQFYFRTVYNYRVFHQHLTLDRKWRRLYWKINYKFPKKRNIIKQLTLLLLFWRKKMNHFSWKYIKYDNFKNKILLNFLVKIIIQKLMCQILCIFKNKWYILSSKTWRW